MCTHTRHIDNKKEVEYFFIVTNIVIEH